MASKSTKTIKSPVNLTKMSHDMEALMNAVLTGAVAPHLARVCFIGAGKVVHIVNAQTKYQTAKTKYGIADIPFAL